MHATLKSVNFHLLFVVHIIYKQNIPFAFYCFIERMSISQTCGS